MSTRTEGRYLHSDLEPGDALRSMLREMLESGRLDSVFLLRRTPAEGRFCYSLVSDPETIDETLPFHPVMPVQAARALTQLTIREPLNGPVAALLRPCELRAFLENVKQSQGSMENLFVISCTCPGVFPASEFIGSGRRDPGKDWDLRNACAACVDFVPGTGADMTVILSSDDAVSGTLVHLATARAEELTDHAEGFSPVDGPDPADRNRTTASERQRVRRALLRDAPPAGEGLSSLVSMFSKCIGCRACRQACPLCNCILCDYETSRTIHSPALVMEESRRRGATRVPSGTLQFHLGRLVHIAPLCTACGQCGDVCPVDIPVAEIFIRAGELVQDTLAYRPGRDPDEGPPLSVYSDGELQEIMD